MKSIIICLLAGLLASLGAGAWAAVPAAERRTTLAPFTSEAELAALFKTWQDQQRRRDEERRALQSAQKSTPMADQNVAGVAPPAPAPTAAPAAAKAEAGAAGESVTNTQTAGVDEGGIVKLHGKHLVVLRRGRLFTVALGDAQLKPVAAIDAFGPDSAPGRAWYDEMLIWGNTIVVIGYSYAGGGTEVGLFDIDQDGGLRYRATYHLRSNDYYSSRNYASRLIGSQLIFYTPLYLNPRAPDPFIAFPAMRKWRGQGQGGEFRRIAPATRIYRTDDELDPWAGLALHTVTVCELARPEMDCQASAVLGPPGRVFYVSAQSVYVWTSSWRHVAGESRTESAVFRIPLNGSAPSALKTSGSPIDQFSFLESEDGHLNVLLRANGRGEAMWAAENSRGDIALLRVALDSFGDGHDSAPAERYRRLPGVAGYSLQNRFIGPYLLYGSGASWGRAQDRSETSVQVVRWAAATPVQALGLSHGVDRIEALGQHALVVGANGPDLHFTSIRLDDSASTASRYVRADAAQGETRSHGFFYKPQSAQDGLLGLPVRAGGQAGARQLREPSAAVVFLKNSGLKLSEMGALDATPGVNQDDACRASCVDWYGNSRPLFIGSRVFALMGYELVEGEVASFGRGAQIRELRRVSFSPGAQRLAR